MKLLAKTTTYAVMHFTVATGVVYAVTGNLAAAVSVGLLEPVIQTLFYALHERAWGGRGQAGRAWLAKMVTYGVMHVVLAAGVVYAITGDLAAAISIGLLEPAVQTLFYALHERLWTSGRRPTMARTLGVSSHALPA